MLLSDGFTSDDVSAQLEAAGGGGGDTNDTGLGSDLECSETRHIVGKADFSEPEGTCMHVACDHHLRLHVQYYVHLSSTCSPQSFSIYPLYLDFITF